RPPAREVLALKHDLRRVDERHALQLAELPLAQGEFALRVGILPADVVPVVDVQRERHDPFGRVTAAREAGKPAVGGRAAAATLRGVELDQGDRLVAGLGLAPGRGGGKRERQECQGKCEPHAGWSESSPRAYG